MKIIGRIILALTFFCVSFSALAGTQKGYVKNIHVRASDGLVYVFLDGPASGRPSCAMATYFMVKNENSVTGKQQLAQLIAARASGQQITIIGANTCTRYFNGEDIDEVILGEE